MRPPRIIPNSPDLLVQVQHHFDLIWQELENQKGVGGKTIRLLGPLDMRGLPIQNTTPSMPTKHSGNHQNGGNDEITVLGLSGLLADDQTPFLMAAGQRGGAKLGDVFALIAEVLTLSIHSTMGIQKVEGGTKLALRQQTPIPAISTVDASDIGTVITLANELKAKFNELLALLKVAEIMSGFEGYFHKYYFHQDYFSDAPSGYFRRVV
jgi:hypothetical protein